MAHSDLQKDVQFYEYTQAADPLGRGAITQEPYAELLSHLHESGQTRVIHFDLAKQLVSDGPITSPNMSAAFVRIEPGKEIATSVNATSQLFYVIRGNGKTKRGDLSIAWSQGDFMVVPGSVQMVHAAETDAALYWINDEPLLKYLGVTSTQEKFSPTLYRAEDCQRELARVAADPNSKDRNRVSILLGNKNFPQTMTVTHTLWAMFGILPKGAVQPAHRHTSVALDLILDCKPGCYSLISRHKDAEGNLINPVRQDWKPYSAFVTPPYFWHSHHNESGADANLIPIQDAGLQTYMRTLNIEFAHPVAKKELSEIL